VQREALAELIRAADLVHRTGMNLDQAVARLNATGSPGPDLGPAVAYCMQVLGRINAAALAIQRHLRSRPDRGEQDRPGGLRRRIPLARPRTRP